MPGRVRPIPAGYHAITPHLTVKDGNAAIAFYKKAFGAEEIVRMPGADGKSIMHAELRIGDSHIMINDEFPEYGVKSPAAYQGSPVTIHLYVDNVDEVFERAISEGAREEMPLQDQFWGDRYGKIVDPFGHRWSLATHIEDVPPEEMEMRAEAAMKQFQKSGS
jgi:uncharacterized glyoxalase superfamily protein PhnB